MRQQKEEFVTFALRVSAQHAKAFRDGELTDAARNRLERAAKDSLAEQSALEAADAPGFKDFLSAYFAQEPINGS